MAKKAKTSARKNTAPGRKKITRKKGLDRNTEFLQALQQCGSPTYACKATGIDRGLMYRERAANPAFAEAWDRAVEIGIAALEDEAIRRAFEGTEKPVTIAGNREVIREYSDTLLIFLLKANKPEKYRERYEVRTVASEAPVPPGGLGFFDACMSRLEN